MICVDPILEILDTVCCSVAVPEEKPISCLLIAGTDSGKSQILLRHVFPGGTVLSDSTAIGLVKMLEKDLTIRTIVIPDFNAVISHRASVSNLTISVLLSLLEEGTAKLVDPSGIRDLKGRTINVITALTPPMLNARAGRWRKTGFLRRFLPIYYSYSPGAREKIHESIRQGQYVRRPEAISVALPEPSRVDIPEPLSILIKEFTYLISERVERRGFTIHKHFRSYAKTRALMRNSQVVTESDFNDLKNMARFVRLEEPEEI